MYLDGLGDAVTEIVDVSEAQVGWQPEEGGTSQDEQLSEIDRVDDELASGAATGEEENRAGSDSDVMTE